MAPRMVQSNQLSTCSISFCQHFALVGNNLIQAKRSIPHTSNFTANSLTSARELGLDLLVGTAFLPNRPISGRLSALPIGVAPCSVLWSLFGWKVAFASGLAGVAMLQIPLLLNVACHIPRLGYKKFARNDDSVNVWWVALLAHGEGWHNNHHAFPGSARSGFTKHEFDLSWEMLRLSRRLGLVTQMNEADPESVENRTTSALLTS
jgi:hypothetical protein